MARMAAPWAFSTAPGPATRGHAHACQPVGAAAVLRAHGQDGYLDECIRGERTALRQAVRPNETKKSLTATWAAMRRQNGVVWEEARTGRQARVRASYLSGCETSLALAVTWRALGKTEGSLGGL